MTGMTTDPYIEDHAAKRGTSLYYATLFVPAPQRAAIMAVDVFCRQIKAIVNAAQEPAVAARKLAWWRREVADAAAGQSSHPVMLGLMPHAATYGIDSAQLLAVIEGCELNLQKNRYLDFAGLAHFSALTASAQGEMVANILGHSEPAAVAFAHRIALAMHLTQIIRDVGNDARRGRIYLPIDELKMFEVKASEILERQSPWGYSDRFTRLMRYQADRAQRTFTEGFALLPAADRRKQRPGLALAQIHLALLREIEAGNFQVLHQRIALTPLRKAWLAMHTHWRER